MVCLRTDILSPMRFTVFVAFIYETIIFWKQPVQNDLIEMDIAKIIKTSIRRSSRVVMLLRMPGQQMPGQQDRGGDRARLLPSGARGQARSAGSGLRLSEDSQASQE